MVLLLVDEVCAMFIFLDVIGEVVGLIRTEAVAGATVVAEEK